MVSTWDAWLPVVLTVVGLLVVGGFFGLMIEGISPQGYTPMSPDEEREWLRDVTSLTEEEIEEYVNGPPIRWH